MSLPASLSGSLCGASLFGGSGGFGHGGWLGGFHFPFGLFLLALFAGLTIWMVNRNRTPVRQETATETLKRRYAAGEIDRESYRSMRNDLDA